MPKEILVKFIPDIRDGRLDFYIPDKIAKEQFELGTISKLPEGYSTLNHGDIVPHIILSNKRIP